MNENHAIILSAEPRSFECRPTRDAPPINDTRRDYPKAGGFVETAGNDPSRLLRAIVPNRGPLEASRAVAAIPPCGARYAPLAPRPAETPRGPAGEAPAP